MALLDITAAPGSSPDLLDLRHRRRDGALKQLIELALARGTVRDAAWALQALLRRERVLSTSPGKGIAVPNVRSISVVRPWLGLARSAKGVEWPGAEDGPVHLVLCVLSPAGISLERHRARVANALHSVRLQKQRQWLLDAVESPELRAWFASVGS